MNFKNSALRLGLAPLVLWCFITGFTELHKIYSSFWLLDNAIAAGCIGLGYIAITLHYHKKTSAKKRSSSNDEQVNFLIVCGFFLLSLTLLLNNFLGGFSIVPPALAYLAVYLYLGLWLQPSFWKRSLPVFLLLLLTLPVLERVQSFIGFPLRLLTAKVVSIFLSLIGAGHVSNATIITTENHATSIDLPCSGVKSLYFGGVVLLAVYFLQRVKLSFKSIGLAVSFFLLLVFFNIWRVFGLVYVYGILRLQEAGDAIHVGLGIFGFAVSCVVLWYGSEILKKDGEKSKSKQKLLTTSQLFSKVSLTLPTLSRFQAIAVSALILFATSALTLTFLPAPLNNSQPQLETKNIRVPGASLTHIPFTGAEETLFLHKDVSFASKYEMSWKGLDSISVLFIRSASARTHHDPELCLQGLGYHLLNEEIVVLPSHPIKKVAIQTSDDPQAPKGTVYYWFVSKDAVITDYSERVWHEFQNADQEWVLVEVARYDTDTLSSEELIELVDTLTASVRSELL